VGVSAAVLGACSGGSEKETVFAPPHLPTSVAESVAPSTSAPAVSGAPSTTRAPGGQGAPVDAGGGDSGATGGAAQSGLAPAQSGIYRYDTSGVSTFGLTSVPYPAVSTLRAATPAGTNQHWTRDLRDAGGSGPITEFGLDFRLDGVYLDDLALTNSFQGMVNVQDLRPTTPALLVPTGAAPGAHSEFDLQSGSGGSAHATVDVTAREVVNVGGQAVDSLVVHTAITLPTGPVSGHVELTGWFAPSARVWAKEHFVADASAAGGLFAFHSQYDATAQSLTPS
jgi:hypothetical protein